jgi:hypothetical protein
LRIIKEFIEKLAKTEVTPNVYNQYSYEHKEFVEGMRQISSGLVC